MLMNVNATQYAIATHGDMAAAFRKINFSETNFLKTRQFHRQFCSKPSITNPVINVTEIYNS